MISDSDGNNDMFMILLAKSCELRTWRWVFPTIGESTFASSTAKELQTDYIPETIRRRGHKGLCILGGPQNLGGSQNELIPADT